MIPTAQQPSQRAVARVQFSDAASKLADFAALLVPTTNDTHQEPGDYIRVARRARVLALRLLNESIALELHSGADWGDVADAYGLTVEEVKARYPELLQEARPLVVTTNFDATVERLDQWCQRNAGATHSQSGAVSQHLDL